MAYGNFVLDKGYDVSAPITKFRAVKYTDTEEVGPVTAEGDAIAGFAQFSVSAAEILKEKGCDVRLEGITEAEVGNTTQIEVGDSVELLADGSVGKASGGGGARVVGVCVGHATANPAVVGDRIALRINLDGGTQ
jgi:predicted RecA/RadA family phage recombinase